MRGNLVETLTGAVVLVVALSFLFAYSRANVGIVRGYELVAKFDRVDGLNVGSDVLISGIKVGSVADQYLDPETYLAVVSLSLDSSVKLPEDSSAEIGSNGLLGDKFVALVPGGAEEMLGQGDEIMFTQGSIDVVGLIGQAIFGRAGEGQSDASGTAE
jgi:phospholipid/cholesterol/gamma-HCH transport system substrate-binding protein